MNQPFSRRSALTGAAALLGASSAGTFAGAEEVPAADWKIEKGRIRQSVVPWCFNPMPLEELAAASAEIGLESVELVAPENWDVLEKHGLVCAITPSGHGFAEGWNQKRHHEKCKDGVLKAIEATAAAGWPNVITFSGMIEQLDPEEGFDNCVVGLKTVLPAAEKAGVNLCLEVLNTRVDENMKGHPGYQADTIEWGVRLCDALGSDRMKILFDVYHVQIMQGDVITRIRQYRDYIAHYHTAGVPGRNELDDRQEINYRGVMAAILETGYDGFVGQEFIPREADPIASLRQAARVCDV